VRLRAITSLGTSLVTVAVLAASAFASAQPSVGGVAAPTGSSQASGGAAGRSTSGAGGVKPASAKQTASTTGGSVYGVTDLLPHPTVPGAVARIVHGLAVAPSLAPPDVQKAIWAANRIIGLPYIYGGGHAAFKASGYDCSGTVSYALHGGHLLSSPLDSSEFMGWGSAGRGQWITIYANGGHAYVDIAGIRLDTSSADDPSGLQGPRWRPLRPSNAGYTVRHPVGY
jgi:hypothetical protein